MTAFFGRNRSGRVGLRRRERRGGGWGQASGAAPLDETTLHYYDGRPSEIRRRGQRREATRRHVRGRGGIAYPKVRTGRWVLFRQWAVFRDRDRSDRSNRRPELFPSPDHSGSGPVISISGLGRRYLEGTPADQGFAKDRPHDHRPASTRSIGRTRPQRVPAGPLPRYHGSGRQARGRGRAPRAAVGLPAVTAAPLLVPMGLRTPRPGGQSFRKSCGQNFWNSHQPACWHQRISLR
jgi:hypothetical protein